MALDKSDINNIAHLARLQIDEQDVAETVRKLSDILGFVKQLDGVDTQEVSPMAHPMDAQQRLREDIVTEENQRDRFQKIAPHAEEGLYLVPKVLE